MWNQPKVHPAAGWEIMWNDTWATSFIIISSSPDNQRQSDSAARARFSVCQSGQHPESSLSTRLLLLPDSSLCVCVFMCVHATWHPQSLRTHCGVWDSENPPRSCSTRDAHSCAQHKGLCTSGSWWCSWFFLFHLLHFETNWQQHFTDPRSVSVKLKTVLDHCKRGNCVLMLCYIWAVSVVQTVLCSIICLWWMVGNLLRWKKATMYNPMW